MNLTDLTYDGHTRSPAPALSVLEGGLGALTDSLVGAGLVLGANSIQHGELITTLGYHANGVPHGGPRIC